MEETEFNSVQYQPVAVVCGDPLDSLLTSSAQKLVSFSKSQPIRQWDPVDYGFPHEQLGTFDSARFFKEVAELSSDDAQPSDLPLMEAAFHPSSIKTEVLDGETLVDFTGGWLDRLEPVPLSLSSLQIAPAEPWQWLVISDDPPANVLYSQASSRVIDPIPFQDPCRRGEDQPTLLGNTVHSSKLNFDDLLQRDLPPSYTAVKDPERYPEIHFDLRSVALPAAPPCDYLAALMAQAVNRAPAHHEDEAQHHEEVQRTPPPSNKDFVDLVMPGDMMDVLEALEAEADLCWEALRRTSGRPPECVRKLMANASARDLEPHKTRQCLVELERELKSTNHSGMRHKEALVPLLKLHGLVKSIRQLIDSDFETAYDTLFEFQETQRHHLNDQLKPMLSRLADLKRRSWHPKMLELRRQIVDHLESTDGKVLVHLARRHSREVSAMGLERLLADCGVADWTLVDPRVRCDDRRRLFVAAQIPHHFPFHVLTLVVHYEDGAAKTVSDYVEGRLASVPRRFLRLGRRPAIASVVPDSVPDDPSPLADPIPPLAEVSAAPLEDPSRFTEVAEEVAEEEVQDSTRHLLVSSRLACAWPELIETWQKDPDIQVDTVDYSFLGPWAELQPDVLLDPLTAVLVVPYERLEPVDQLRRRVLLAGASCRCCWVVVVFESDDGDELRRPLAWSRLVALALRRTGGAPACRLRLRRVSGRRQAAAVVADLADLHRCPRPTAPHSDPASQALEERLLRFPFVNALTARMVAASGVAASDLVDLPVHQLVDRVPPHLPVAVLQQLRRALAADADDALWQQNDVVSSFGRLKVSWSGQPPASAPFRDSPKRLKLERHVGVDEELWRCWPSQVDDESAVAAEGFVTKH